MQNGRTFDARLAASLAQLGPSELRVAEHIRDNREDALVSSASALAARTSTSDATVIRAIRALGYAGMAELRQELAGELRGDLSLASRMARTLDEVGSSPTSSFDVTLERHTQSIQRLRRDISPALFSAVVASIAAASRVIIFGIGPSSAMASYFAIQLGRQGIDAGTLTDTGLLLADGLHKLRRSDVLVVLAFGRPYAEVTTLLEHAREVGLQTVLITDALGAALKRLTVHVLPVQRGSIDALSLHTATLALIEAILVGVASRRPADTIASLEKLNALRKRIARQPMDLPVPVDKPTKGAKSRKSPQ